MSRKTFIKNSLGLCTWLAAIALLTSSCNKDDEIVEEIPPVVPSEEDFQVVEYLPAPGQFINEKASGFDNVTTMEAACEYARKRLNANLYVSLGAWGGYVVVKSKGSIPNTGGYDFSIAGNAFDTSNEAGIVWVMEDSNANGLPDDEWYELKGSWFDKEGYERNYSVTYFRPDGPGDVRWRDSNGEEGIIKWMNSFHPQNYYPAWEKENSYTLTGSRLPSQAYQNPETGVWTNAPFEWGYADNEGEDSAIVTVNGKKVQKNYFRISDAVDADSKPVILEKIDFIKVQTAINSNAGVVGENSTEVCGFFLE